MRTLWFLSLVIVSTLVEGGPPKPPSTSAVEATLYESLKSSIPIHQQHQQIGTLLKKEQLEKLEKLYKSLLPEQQRVITELQDLVRMKGGLGRSGVLDFLEAILKAIMRALELDLREVFIILVEPIVELAVMLNPLPEYQFTKVPMDGDMEMRYIEETFENWGSTILTNVTVRTFFPRTVLGIQNIVKLAAQEGRRVRASATRHTFNPWLWGVESGMQPGHEGHNVDYVIAMLPMEISDHLAYARDPGTWPEDSELVNVEGPLSIWEEDGEKKAAVRFGAGTLNKHYVEWALANNFTLPSNTIMHYMSLGGVMMGTCHGGGIGHQTMADRLLEVTYVDSKGDLITLTDQSHINVFGGSMGMLGIVTSLTYKLDEMSYARFWPQTIKNGLNSILPRPGEAPVPNETVHWMTHYYSEFIQYPTHHGAPGVLWKNTWDNLGKAEDAITLIDHLEDEFQRDYVFLETVALQGFKTLHENFPSETFLSWMFGYLVGASSKLAMKDWEEPVTTTATEAMHFQRGLHYLSVRAAEMIVPIPSLEDGSPDWELVQQVVWDLAAVLEGFESQDKYPVDLAIEDRFMGGTSMLLGAQHGNTYSLAIEVTSSPLVELELWEEFKEAMASNWPKYKNKEGEKLSVRPHWAKEFPRTVNGDSIETYMDSVYSTQMANYVEGMYELMEFTGGNLTQTLDMFNTKYMDKLMFKYL